MWENKKCVAIVASSRSAWVASSTTRGGSLCFTRCPWLHQFACVPVKRWCCWGGVTPYFCNGARPARCEYGRSFCWRQVLLFYNLEWDLLKQMHTCTLGCIVSPQVTNCKHKWQNTVHQVSGVQKGTITVEAMRMLSTTEAFLVTKSVPLLMQGTSCAEPSSNVQNQFIKPQHCWCESVDRQCRRKLKRLGPFILTEPYKISSSRYWQLAQSVWELSYPECASTEVGKEHWHLFECNYTMHFQRTSCQHAALAGMPACFIGRSGCHTVPAAPSLSLKLGCWRMRPVPGRRPGTWAQAAGPIGTLLAL